MKAIFEYRAAALYKHFFGKLLPVCDRLVSTDMDIISPLTCPLFGIVVCSSIWILLNHTQNMF